ncbi:RNA-directed DNA polymerase, eukaryota, reverse transcriptase zinc-binding domain protein [Tanacetum coccineum]
MENVNCFCVKHCWGNLSFEYVCGPLVGNSGGILCVWDPRLFRKHNSTVSDYFVAIQGEWIPSAMKCFIISVYAPQDVSKKKMLWNYLNHVINTWTGETIIMGDFNEVRSKDESESNISIIVHALNCFHQASGLRLNMHKSKLVGIAVENEKVIRAAENIGCLSLNTPFPYLGIKVGGLMFRLNSWDEVVDNLHSRLSKWKMKTLSIGGRLTLLKSVLGSMPIYNISMFKIPSQVLKRMEAIKCHFFNGAEPHEKKM